MQFRIETNRSRALSSVCTLAAVSLSAAGCGGGSGSVTSAGVTRVVNGETQTISGATVTAWARLDGTDKVLEAGVTLPFSVLENPPASSESRAAHKTRQEDDGTGDSGNTGGDTGDTTGDPSNIYETGVGAAAPAGPAGAFVVVGFPDAVKKSTFFNHFEMHWNPTGHPPARYAAPHFDLHFYNETLNQVEAITAPDTVAPNASHIPTGYLYPGVAETVPRMGVHAVDSSEFAPGAPPFSASMVLGYHRGSMTFVEPMITQAAFLTKQTITLSVPRPAVLGQAVRYPTKFTAVYSPELNAYQCTFTDFVTVSQ